MNYPKAIQQLQAIYQSLPEFVADDDEQAAKLTSIVALALAIATKCNSRLDWVVGSGDSLTLLQLTDS